MMTPEEYNAREEEILKDLPEEFHSAISYYAYEKGHAYGHEEVLIYLSEIADMLLPCIAKYTERVKSSKD